MIVAPKAGQLLVVTQSDHAHFASELLALWRSGGMPEHPRRRELLFAAREHDNGWAEIDSAPMCHPESGRPRDFMTVSRETRWDIWRRGTRRYIEREPYAALLIVRHAIHLHRSQSSDPAWADLFNEWHDLEAELIETTGAVEEDVASDYRWIELTDLLSLAVCNRWDRRLELLGWIAQLEALADNESPGARPDLRTGSCSVGLGRGASPKAEDLGADLLLIDPFPLAGTTTFQVAGRMIPDRRYASDVDLGIELASARWGHHTVQVRAEPSV